MKGESKVDTQKTYYNKIKTFIIWTTLISQIFICVTFSYSYLHFKFKNDNNLSRNQRDYYTKAIQSLSSKIDNMLYLFEESGAISFCSQNYSFKSDKEIEQAYDSLVSALNYSDLNQRYFQSIFLLSNNDYNFSLAKTDGIFSKPNDFNLNYYYLMNFDRPNGFNTNYQKIYRFNKNNLGNIKFDPSTKESYEFFINHLDGKYVYYTIQHNVLCAFVFNDNIFNTIFESAKIRNTSIVLKNKSGEILYSNIDNIDNSIYEENYTERNETFNLYIKPHTGFSATDIFFILFMMFLCGIIIFIMLRYSDLYASKIMEPYRILNNFFRMNKSVAEFDLSDYNSSTKKRTLIMKIFFKAYVYTIFIPSAISLAISTVTLHFSTQHFSKENVAITHAHLTNEFYNNFDFFITNNVSKTENSHFNYTVTLDSNHNIASHPFESVNHNNIQLFNKTVKPLAGTAKTGTLIHINNDLFGEKAIGIFKKISDEIILLNVIKTENIDNVSLDKSVNFILTDSNDNIITQSPFNSVSASDCINKKTDVAIRNHSFDEYNWTLYTFANSKEVSTQINNITKWNLLIILFFLLTFGLFTWYTSISFTHPIEYIISAISKYPINNRKEKNKLPYNNETEELLAMYNVMLDRIEKISEEKLAILTEKERLNTVKIQAELNALQHQINPHFLYNTLQAISLNISDYNTSEIMAITSSLSDIYRYATSNSKAFYLCDEFENLRNYIYIWTALFPDRFTVEYDIDPNAEIVPSPKLILQPIVENCFFRAFKNKSDNCNLKIEAKIEDDYVYISISDNGCGIEPDALKTLLEKIKDSEQQPEKKGIGIKNLYQRMKIYYGDSFRFDIKSTPNVGTTVMLKFSIYTEFFDE